MAIKTIDVKGYSKVRKEAIAGGAITPGDLCEITATGTIIVHNSAGATAQAKFAVENEVVGAGIDDDYATNDTVLYGVFPPGSEIYAWVADGEVVVIGSYLDSKGDGTLQVVDTRAATSDLQLHGVVAVAMQATSPSGADGRCLVEVI